MDIIGCATCRFSPCLPLRLSPLLLDLCTRPAGEFQFIAAFANEEVPPCPSGHLGHCNTSIFRCVQLRCRASHLWSELELCSLVQGKLQKAIFLCWEKGISWSQMRSWLCSVQKAYWAFCKSVESPVVKGGHSFVFQLNLDSQGSILSLQREHFWNRLPHAAARFLGVIPLSAAG